MKYFLGKVIISALVTVLHAQEVHMHHSKGKQKNPYQEMESRETIFIPEQTSDSLSGTVIKKDAISLPGHSGSQYKGKTLSNKDRILDKGQGLSGTFDETESYAQSSTMAPFKSLHNIGRIGYSFVFFNDGDEVKDGKNTFNDTYTMRPENRRYGTLLISTNRYYYKSSFLNLAWGLGIGVGFNQGKGHFSSGKRSDIGFKLFRVPLDIFLTAEIPVWTLFRLSFSGGPSLMGLHQSRDDFENREKGKHRRQISTGYALVGKFRLSLSKLLPSTRFLMSSQNGVNNFFLNVEARYHSYRKFQDPLVMEGWSWGGGFSFEFL